MHLINEFFWFFRSSFYFFIVFFLLTLYFENGTKSTKNRFSSKSVIFSHFWGFKNSKQGLCAYKALAIPVHTKSKMCCTHILFFEDFIPKPLRKINVYSCSKQRLWTSKDRQRTLQQWSKKVHEQVNAKTDFLFHVGTILYLFYFLVGWF